MSPTSIIGIAFFSLPGSLDFSNSKTYRNAQFLLEAQVLKALPVRTYYGKRSYYAVQTSKGPLRG